MRCVNVTFRDTVLPMSSVAALLALALAGSPADRLVEARQLADEFQYDKALKLAEATLKEPDIGRDTLLGLYELVGISAATLDRGAKAREAFLLLVLVAPEHQLSRNLPPRVRTPYFEARNQAGRLGAVALAAAPAERVQGLVRLLTLTVKDVPLLPARAVRLHLREDDRAERVETVPVPASRRVQVAVSGAALRWKAELLGDRGAVLQVLQGEELPPPPPAVVLAPPPLPAPEPPPPPTRGWMRPTGYTVGAVGLLALGGGAVFGFLSSDARARIANATRQGQVVTGLTQRDAAALDATARTGALLANVGFIAGGVLAATGAALVAFGGERAPAVSVLVGPGGLAVVGAF